MSTAAVTDLESLRQWMRTQGAPPLPRREEALPSGSDALDALIGGGFPKGGVTVLAGPSGVGRMSLAAQLLARETAKGRTGAWIDGQGTLYPPALASLGVDLTRALIVRAPDRAKALHAAEQIITSSAFSVVIASGIDEGLTPVRLRRLQSATEAARVCTLLVLQDGGRASGTALRLRLMRRDARVVIELERSRQGPSGGRASVEVA
ncbi:MAG: hypothetical protein IT384_13305 [Deltaproteobacteria bacterium]|nr:hypothetical protein [Deltaproteobacteria bacterium]